jgi:hypothetical protein
MAKMVITFTECEHAGDLENYKADLTDSGATVLSSTENFHEEECTITVQITDYEDFIRRFEDTDAYEFSSLYD